MSVSGRYPFIPLLGISVREVSASPLLLPPCRIPPAYSLFVATYRYTAAKKKLSIERYVTGLIELDLFPERFSDRFISLTAEQKEQLRDAAHTASASARQIAETLDAARDHDGQIGSMIL